MPPGNIGHPGCRAERPEPWTGGGLRGEIVRWTGCAGTGASFSEAGLFDQRDRFAIYMQVKQPAGEDRTAAILRSLRVPDG